MTQTQFTIQANAKGTKLTDWILEPNAKVLIRRIGQKWTSNPNVAPHDYDANGNPNYTVSDCYLYPGAFEGCLIACLGNPATSKWKVGNMGIVEGDPLLSQPLWLACNDDWDAVGGFGYTDNQGALTIEVIPYTQFLNELHDESIMQTFIDELGRHAGINSIEQLNDEIKNMSDKLLGLSSESSTTHVGQVVHNMAPIQTDS
jgi:hypothetical protein